VAAPPFRDRWKKDAAGLGICLRRRAVCGLIATTPAGATIEKFMNQCDGRAYLTILSKY
jgi:hypothetical protein